MTVFSDDELDLLAWGDASREEVAAASVAQAARYDELVRRRELAAIARDSGEPEWLADQRRAALDATDPPRTNGTRPTFDILETWGEVDLGAVLRGELTPVEPTLLRRSDGRALLYRGRVCGLHGDSAVGKSMVAAVLAAQLLTAGEDVVWIDLEDPDATTLLERLLELFGVDADTIEARLHYFSPSEPITALAVELIKAKVREHNVRLVVIDSEGEAFGLEGINENADDEVGPWFRRVARAIADDGPCVLLIDHGTKAADNPLHASGSKRKRAAITGASYLVEAPTPLTRETGGRLRLTCAKDRHGYHRRGAVAAEIELTVYPDQGVTVHVWPPSSTTADTPDAKLDAIARAAVRAVKAADHPLSRNELEHLMTIKAAAAAKRAGIDRAVALGAIRTDPGSRGATLHHYVRDLDTERPT